VILYIPGVCPGDEGIPCDSYRAKEGEVDLDSWFGSVYSSVCGYLKRKCQDPSCRRTFKDHLEACRDPNVLFFIDGPCEN